MHRRLKIKKLPANASSFFLKKAQELLLSFFAVLVSVSAAFSSFDFFCANSTVFVGIVSSDEVSNGFFCFWSSCRLWIRTQSSACWRHSPESTGIGYFTAGSKEAPVRWIV